MQELDHLISESSNENKLNFCTQQVFNKCLLSWIELGGKLVWFGSQGYCSVSWHYTQIPIVLTLILSQSSHLFLWQNLLSLVSAVPEACHVGKLQQQPDFPCPPFPRENVPSKMKMASAPHLQSATGFLLPWLVGSELLSGNLHMSKTSSSVAGIVRGCPGLSVSPHA